MEPERADTLLMRADELEAAVVGAPPRGRAAALAVLGAAEAEGHAEAAVVALRALGQAGRLLGQYDDAMTALDRAVRLARTRGLPVRLVDVLVTRAGVRLERGQLGAAARDLTAARLRTDVAHAEVEFLQGRVDEESGRLLDAAASYRRARALAVGGTPELQLKILNELAVAEGLLGRHDEAERLLVEALALAAGVGEVAEGFITHNLGWVALQGSHLVDGLRWFETAEQQLRAGGFPLTEHELDQLEAFLAMRLAREGLELAARVVASFEDTGNQLALAPARLKQARLFLLADQPADAAGAADEAARLFRRQRRTAWTARAAVTGVEARLAAGSSSRSDLRRCADAVTELHAAGFAQEAADAELVAARVALALGATGRAEQSLAAVVAAGGTSLPHRVRGAVAGALLARLRADPAGVRRAAEAGLRELERYRATLGSTELRALASGHGQELAALGLGAALASRRARGVFGWLERGRVRSLLGSVPADAGVELTAALAELRRLRAQAGDDPDGDDDGRIARAEARVGRLARLAAGSGRGVGVGRPIDVAAVRGALGEDVLVEVGVHAGRLVAVTVGAGGARTRELGSVAEVEAELAHLLAALRRLARPAGSEAAAGRALAAARDALADLDALVLGPVGRRLADAPAIVVSPPAALMALPWGSLPSLAGRAVTVTPAAGLWLAARVRAAVRVPGGPVVLGAGPRLRGAPDEVAALARLHPSSTVLTPPESTVSRVLGALDGAALAHLACHASFRRDNPMFSALELADGPLVVHDVERLTNPPAVVVLAACDSGLSEVYSGEELVGFLSVLLASGTDSMVASVVPVPDLDTTPFMTAFHTRLLAGDRPAAALAAARGATADATPTAFLTATAFTCFGAG